MVNAQRFTQLRTYLVCEVVFRLLTCPRKVGHANRCARRNTKGKGLRGVGRNGIVSNRRARRNCHDHEGEANDGDLLKDGSDGPRQAFQAGTHFADRFNGSQGCKVNRVPHSNGRNGGMDRRQARRHSTLEVTARSFLHPFRRRVRPSNDLRTANDYGRYRGRRRRVGEKDNKFGAGSGDGCNRSRTPGSSRASTTCAHSSGGYRWRGRWLWPRGRGRFFGLEHGSERVL